MAKTNRNTEDSKFVIYRGQKMAKGWPAKIKKAQKSTTYCIGADTFERIPYGNERNGPDAEHNPCPDCGAIKGQLHVPDCCEIEECPKCHGQRFSCTCSLLPRRHPEPKESDDVATHMAALARTLEAIKSHWDTLPPAVYVETMANAVGHLAASLERAKQVFLPADFPSLRDAAAHGREAATAARLLEMARQSFVYNEFPPLSELRRIYEQTKQLCHHLGHVEHGFYKGGLTRDHLDPDDLESDAAEAREGDAPDEVEITDVSAHQNPLLGQLDAAEHTERGFERRDDINLELSQEAEAARLDAEQPPPDDTAPHGRQPE